MACKKKQKNVSKIKQEVMIKQAETLLFSVLKRFSNWISGLIEIIVCTTAIGNLIGWCLFFCFDLLPGINAKKEGYAYECPKWYDGLDMKGRFIFEVSLMFILVMWGMFLKFRYLGRLSTITLSLAALINFIYIFLNIEPEWVFYSSTTVIYVTFVILTVRRLSK